MQFNDAISFQFPKKSPAEYVECTRAVCEAMQQQGLSPRLTWSTLFATLQSPHAQWTESLKELEVHLSAQPADDIVNIAASAGSNNLRITIARIQNSVYDTVTINEIKHARPPEELFSLIASHFPAQDPKHRRFFERLPAELAEFHKAQEEIFAKQRMELVDGYAKLRDTINETQAQANRRIEDMRLELEAHRKKLEAEHEGRLERLQHEREQFEKEKILIQRSCKNARSQAA